MPVLKGAMEANPGLLAAEVAQDTGDTPAPVGTAAILISAIAFGGLIGMTVPGSWAGEVLSGWVDTTLHVMIFLLFFELRSTAIIRAFSNFRFLALAWAANFLVIPMLGFAVAGLFFSGQPLLFAGLMIYFLAPCTDWFLGFTRLAKGDAELGAVLIPINMVTQVLAFPLWLWLFANSSGLVELSAMPAMLLQWFLLPLIAAQSIRFLLNRTLAPAIRQALFSAVSRSVPFILAALVFQLFAGHVGAIAINPSVGVTAAGAVGLFFLCTFAAGEVFSRLGRLDTPQRTLLSMTMAARNAPLMLALTAIAIPDQPMVLAVIVLGMLVEIPLLTALKHIQLKRAGLVT
ncbi:MAG: arsenic resistance protein [Pseudomonadota bacterium]